MVIVLVHILLMRWIMILIHALVSNIDTISCSMVYSLKRININVFAMFITSMVVAAVMWCSHFLLYPYLELISKLSKDGLSTLIYLFMSFLSFEEYTKKRINDDIVISDINNDDRINYFEAILLGLYLSLDNFLIALPLMFNNENIIIISIVFAFFTFVALYIGKKIGSKFLDHRWLLKYTWVIFGVLAIIHIY